MDSSDNDSNTSNNISKRLLIKYNKNKLSNIHLMVY